MAWFVCFIQTVSTRFYSMDTMAFTVLTALGWCILIIDMHCMIRPIIFYLTYCGSASIWTLNCSAKNFFFVKYP